jgi:hypothetical protein
MFRQEILPKLATVKLREIVEATGLSKAYGLDESAPASSRRMCRPGRRSASW